MNPGIHQPPLPSIWFVQTRGNLRLVPRSHLFLEFHVTQIAGGIQEVLGTGLVVVPRGDGWRALGAMSRGHQAKW